MTGAPEWALRVAVPLRILLLGLAVLSSVLIAWVGFFLPNPSPRTLDWLAPLENREFGLIETLQHSILLGLCVYAGVLVPLRQNRRQRLSLIGASLLFGALFLEEVDYFLHFYDAALRQETYTTAVGGLRNVHNVPALYSLMGKGPGLLMTGSILVAAAALVFRRNPLSTFALIHPAGAWAMILIPQVFLCAIYFGTIYPEDVRQVFSETLELTLYTSWCWLTACGPVSSGMSPARTQA